MSYLQIVGGGGGAGTVTNTGGALTANAVVLGAGGNDEKVTTAFITDGAAVLTVGIAGGGNGSLALSGNTSGTATFTAPAIAGTRTNGVTSSNNLLVPSSVVASPGIGLAGSPTYGYGVLAAGDSFFTRNGTGTLAVNNTSARFLNTCAVGFSIGDPTTTSADIAFSRLGAGLVAVGTGTANSVAGLIISANSVFVTANFTTSGVGTALEAITGLSITVPAVAANWKFHAHLAYSQAVGTAAVGFGIQAVTNNPTNIFATGEMFTAAGTVTTGVLATLATTTATQIVSGTPGATGTNLVTDIYGTAELGASANTIRLSVSTATAADLVTVLRGSYFSFCP